FVATNKSIICHANLQIKLETFSHTQQASKYTQSNGAETALTINLPHGPHRIASCRMQKCEYSLELMKKRTAITTFVIENT
ncbi:hypothetical protein, partial [Agrobacterium vitis]|uniref:hypothetical protein n=2 Tax=Rhizobiaceae TaxID=82115 RepID=UPI001AEDDED2